MRIFICFRLGRVPQQPIPPPPRARLKRPMPPQMSANGMLPNNALSVAKQRRMDVLVPDRNEEVDCQIIAQQKRNDGVPVIQNVQGGANVQGSTGNANRNDPTYHLTDAITLSVRQPGKYFHIIIFLVERSFKVIKLCWHELVEVTPFYFII